MYSPLAYQQRNWRAKESEKNLLSAVLSTIVIALLSTSIAQPRWFSLKGGGCSKKSLGVYEFLYVGYFEESVPYGNDSSAEIFRDLVYFTFDEKLVNCVTPPIISLIRIVIAFLFLAIGTSLFAFVMDTLGVTNRVLKILRRNSIGNIFTVLFCVTIIGLCYLISTLIGTQQEMTKPNRGTKVEVRFDISFFLLTSAGAVAVLATAANLLLRYPPVDDAQDDPLLDEYDGVETFSVACPRNGDVPMLQYHLPAPPPPYTP